MDLFLFSMLKAGCKLYLSVYKYAHFEIKNEFIRCIDENEVTSA